MNSTIAIHRLTIAGSGIPFKAPEKVTFGYQKERGTFSVWFRSDDQYSATYIMLPTGEETQLPISIEQSIVMDDGYTVFHLCRVNSTDTHCD